MPSAKKSTAKNNTDVDAAISKQKNTSIDQTAGEAEKETRTRKPGASGGDNSKQHNNGRGGGK